MRMIALFICTITLSLTACVNMLEDGILDNQRRANKVLSISVLTEPATKDLIVSTYLPSTSQVGVFLTDGSDGDYDGHSYNNICYEAVGSDADQTWTSSTSIPLSMNEGYCYAYYPYDSEVISLTDIPVSTANQIDYLVAKPVTVNAVNRNAALTMRHALTAVRFILKKGDYSGTGLMTAVSVQSDGLGSTGTLNAQTGEISEVQGRNTAISVPKSLTLTDEAQEVNVICIPTGETADLSLSINLDNRVFSTVVSGVTLTQGYCHTYTLTVNEGNLALSGIKIGDWGYDESGDPMIMAGNYKITFEGDYEDIAFSNQVSGDQVIIKAINFDGNGVNEVSVSEGANITQTVVGNTRIITLSDISKDVVITFNGIDLFWENFKGVCIERIDGELFLASDWSSEYQANAIVVRTDDTEFRMAITEPGKMMMSSGWYDPVYNYLPILDLETAKKDYGSKSNTNALLRMQTSYAIGYCANYTFPDGKTKGLLPAFGWLYETHLHEVEINQALTLVGGSLLKSDEAYWSSSYFGKDDYAPQQYPRLWRMKFLNAASEYESNSWNVYSAGAMRDLHYTRAYAEFSLN